MMVTCPLRCGRRHHPTSATLGNHQRLADLAGIRQSVYLTVSEIQAELAQRDPMPSIFAALTDEDEIAHGEAVVEHGGHTVGIGRCAYCDDEWPCRTQRGIDRLLANMAATLAVSS